jgi:hypothetical protein
MGRIASTHAYTHLSRIGTHLRRGDIMTCAHRDISRTCALDVALSLHQSLIELKEGIIRQ